MPVRSPSLSPSTSFLTTPIASARDNNARTVAIATPDTFERVNSATLSNADPVQPEDASTAASNVADLPYEPGKTYQLTILHTNDTHGRYWKDRKGRYGFAAQKTLVDQIRKEVATKGGEVLLLSGGDINTGAPRSDLLSAEPDFRGMAKIGYDCMALGNHEFDNPRNVLQKQQQWAGFPFLGANIYDQATNQHAFDSTFIKNVGGLKVGVVGLLTEDTSSIAAPANTSGLYFRPVCEEAREIVPSLREKVGLVIGLTHVGHYGDANHGDRAPGDESIARAVEGIDVIVGGHTQITMKKPDIEGDTIIVQAGEWGQYLGRLDLSVKDGEIISHDYNLIPINAKKKLKDANGKPILDANGKKIYRFTGPEIKESKSMLDLLKPFYDEGGEQLDIVLGTTEEKLYGRPAQRKCETNLGRLIATSHRLIANADVGMVNDGGVRANIAAGETTYEEVLEVMPFGNTVCTFEMTGPEFTSYLNTLFSQNEIMHFDGVKISKRDDKVVGLTIGGELVALTTDAEDSERTYKIALNNYVAKGGSDWVDQSGNPSFLDTGFNDALALKEFLQKHPVVKRGEFIPNSIVNLEEESASQVA